jgi:RNA polymerase sigma-70 factor (ECF subfamily)
VPDRATPSDPDARVLQRLRGGEDAALAELVARHDARLRRLVRSHVRSEESAADVVQETWIAFVRGLERFEGRCRVGTWLERIARNKARTAGRREARCVPVGDELGEAITPGPEPQALARSEAARLRAAVAELPALHRDVLVLCDVLDWPRDQVARRLGLSAGNTRVVLHRARKAVRAAVAPMVSAA